MLKHSTWARHSWYLAACLQLGVCTWNVHASAQPAPATPPNEEPATAPDPDDKDDKAPAPAAAAPSASPASEPAPAIMPPAPPPPPVSAIPDGEAPKGPIAPAFPPAIPSIDFGGRLQAALKLQNPTDPTKMNDISEVLSADMLMSGQIHRYFKWLVSATFSYAGNPGQAAAVTFAPLDVIARIEPLPEFNIYLGRMLVVADRFAPSGPWGMDEFFFPGFFPGVAAPAMPKANAVGRDVGVTVWGAPMKGHVKYYLGAFNLYDPLLNPLLTGRLQVSLLNGEPNFFHRTTYFGTKDLISLGVGGQYQKAGSVQNVPVTTPPTVPLTDDYTSLIADLTVEKNIGDSGTLSVVGGYYKYGGDFNRWKDYWVASVGYMLPKPIGIGKVRATVRYQRGLDAAPNADPSSLVDAQLSYNIAAWFARIQVGYRRGDTYLAGNPMTMTPARSQDSNMLYFGITLADP
ncbi:MAG TPA: hypothetical protein VFK05_04825 [Polyangiaceae bacterium]|nr:hypothetical protein [Polyangiaceae bacterium]